MQHVEPIDWNTEVGTSSYAGFFWTVGGILATVLTVLWTHFGGACDGSIVCGVVPVYFAVVFMFLLAVTELAVTAVWWLVRATDAASPLP